MSESLPFSLRNAALGDLDHELATTRRVIERLRDEHVGWKPHEKSMSLGDLAYHLANLLFWQVATVQHDDFDLAPLPPPVFGVERSRDEILARFDEGRAAFGAALDGLGDEGLAREWVLRRGDQVILRMPKAAAIRTMGISHIIHHRGQLTVYLRLLGLPVPAIYGPSADESR